MTRYVYVPATGNPFILNYWLHFCNKNIKPYVDKIFIGQHGNTDPQLLKVTKELCKDNELEFRSTPFGRHSAGKSLENAFGQECSADTLLLLETDCFVFDSIIDDYFKKIEKGDLDLIGSTRPGQTDIVFDEPEQLGSFYHTENMWPCFLFCRSSVFNTAAKDMTTYLKHVVPTLNNPECLFHNSRGNEEFASFSVLLQYHAKKTETVPQIRAAPEMTKGSWIHFGKLEQMTLPGNILRHENNVSLIFDSSELPNISPLRDHPTGRTEHPMFLGMYMACVEYAKNNPFFKKIYPSHMKAIKQAIDILDFDSNKVEEYKNIFLGWLND